MARKAAVDTAGATMTAEEALLEKYKNFAGIKAVTRRLANPEHDPGSVDIRLNDEPDYVTDPLGKRRKWYLRWVNGDQEGRWSIVSDVKGYEPVRVSELRNPQSVTGLHKAAQDGTDPLVRRGDRGQEILVKMPLELYNYVKHSQEAARRKRARNAKLVKEDLANAAGSALGSEAGDMVHDEFDLSVKTMRKTSLAAEIGDEDQA